jgi:hypothetical protein
MDLLAPDGALRNRTAEVRIAQLVEELDALERQGDAASWEKATAYVIAYDELGEEPEFKGKHGQALTRAINNRIRAHAQEAQKQIPRPSFLANAKKLESTWPEIFSSGTKLLAYQHYRQIAVCGLPRGQKDELRAWAEQAQPTRVWPGPATAPGGICPRRRRRARSGTARKAPRGGKRRGRRWPRERPRLCRR